MAEVQNEAVNEVEKIAQELVPGMVVRVHQKVKELNTKGEERDRIQVFEGTVIAVKGKDAQSRTITVRKIASGVGVERIFPVKSTVVDKIEVLRRGRVRRAKLYYLRGLRGKAARIDERREEAPGKNAG